MYMLYAVVFFGQILAFFVSVLSLAIMNREQIPPYNVFSAIVVPGGGGGGEGEQSTIEEKSDSAKTGIVAFPQGE